MELKPISMKVPVGVLARIDAAAAERGTSRTALLLAMWDAPPLVAVEPEAALAVLPPDLQAFVAKQAKGAGRTVSEWVERCIRAAKLTLEEPDPPLKLARSDPFRSRLKGEWKAP